MRLGYKMHPESSTSHWRSEFKAVNMAICCSAGTCMKTLSNPDVSDMVTTSWLRNETIRDSAPIQFSLSEDMLLASDKKSLQDKCTLRVI